MLKFGRYRNVQQQKFSRKAITKHGLSFIVSCMVLFASFNASAAATDKLFAAIQDEVPRREHGHGKYVLPGLISSHAHIHSMQSGQQVTPDYIFKLWLGHGITRIREVYGERSESRLIALKALSEANAITAPRITAFPFFGATRDGSTKLPAIVTAEDARKRVKDLKRKGADGMNLSLPKKPRKKVQLT